MSKDTTIKSDIEAIAEIEKIRNEFLQRVDVRILDSTDNASSFSAIIDSKGPIVIK